MKFALANIHLVPLELAFQLPRFSEEFVSSGLFDIAGFAAGEWSW